MRPDVALAFDRMERAARRAGHRADRRQRAAIERRAGAALRRQPRPEVGRAAGRSLHRLGTELDLGPIGAYGWLAANAPRFGFVKRYSWEPWHFGFGANPGSASVGFGRRAGDGAGGRRSGRLPAVRCPRGCRRVRAAGARLRAALGRRRRAARRAAAPGVGVQPARGLARRRARHGAVHAGDRAQLRPARPVRSGRRDRRAGPPHARPAAPLRVGAARARRLQRRAGARGRLLVRAADRRDAGLRAPHRRARARRRDSRAAAALVRLVR